MRFNATIRWFPSGTNSLSTFHKDIPASNVIRKALTGSFVKSGWDLLDLVQANPCSSGAASDFLLKEARVSAQLQCKPVVENIVKRYVDTALQTGHFICYRH